jgi:hypothetical protein
MYVQTFTYGKVPIHFWEVLVMVLLLFIVYLAGAAIRKRNIVKHPEYKYFIYGLWTKILGGLFFACIYIFYYVQGDTTSYYECAMSFSKLFFHDFGDFLQAYFGDGSPETKSFFTADTGEPMMYMFGESSTRFTMKLIVPFMIVSGDSYFITTLLVSIFTYGALWRLYMMFSGYFPEYRKQLAYAILFMPSVMFWGSGILKDSFTLAATCYLIVAFNQFIQRKGNMFLNVISILVFSLVVISIKAYIMIILMPSSFVWLFYNRISKMKNRLLRNLIVPFVYVVIVGGSYFGLKAFGESLGKFSIDKALKTASINQNDLKQEYYEGNSFDIGDFEPTIAGALSKFPQATMAGLFRPYIWDTRNVVMLLSGLENLFIMGLTFLVLLRMKWKRIYLFVSDHPIILYSMVFSVLFAYMVGLTTPNFGALVRFKIPLIPLYMACLMVIYGELRKKHTLGFEAKKLRKYSVK